MNSVPEQRLPNQQGERGVFIVLGALWMSAFLMLAALAIDTYMLATAKLQQGNTVEYMALAGLRAVLDPAPGAAPPPSSGGEQHVYNFAIDRAVLVAQSPLMGTSHAQVSASQLYVRPSSGKDDAGEGCGDDEGDANNSAGREAGGHCVGTDECPESAKDKWCGFEGAGDEGLGAVIFGRYDSSTGSFSPAAPGAASTVNAIKVRLQLQNPQNSPMVLPMMKLLIGNGSIMFQSTATAVKDSNGMYRLVSSS